MITDFAKPDPRLVRFEKLTQVSEYNLRIFTLRYKPVEGTVIITLNGVIQDPESDYDIEDNIVCMVDKISPQCKLKAFYYKAE